MADIFGGTAPPAWLVAETQQTPGELGSIGGLALGGILNALQQAPPQKVPVKDPNTGDITLQDAPKKEGFAGWLDSRKGLREGLAEARLNIEDPLWRVKVEQAQANILGTYANLENQLALARERKAETAAWMEDTAGMSAWLAATPEQRETMGTPTAKSKQGLTLIERTQNADNNYFTRKEQNRIRQEQADNQNAASKAINANTKSFYDLLGTVDNEVDRAQILGLLKNGLPTQEAWAALSAAPKTTKEQAKTKGAIEVEKEKQKGRTALEDQRQEGRETLEAEREAGQQELEGQRQQGRETIEANKEKAKKEFEEQRQKDRIEIKKIEGDLKIDLEKMKLGGKDDKGRVVSEDEYVNRHFNTLFNAAWKEADVKDIRVITQQVERALRLRYRTEHKQAPKPAAPPAAAASTNQTATATAPATTAAATNAAPATATAPPAKGTNDISFDDFQNWMKSK